MDGADYAKKRLISTISQPFFLVAEVSGEPDRSKYNFCSTIERFDFRGRMIPLAISSNRACFI
jgi:hypothetical protein